MLRVVRFGAPWFGVGISVRACRQGLVVHIDEMSGKESVRELEFVSGVFGTYCMRLHGAVRLLGASVAEAVVALLCRVVPCLDSRTLRAEPRQVRVVGAVQRHRVRWEGRI